MLILRETYLIDLPLNKIELLIMVINSHKFHQDLLRMRNILGLAAITIWEIGPTSFGNISMVINDQVISKTWSVLSMHCNHKLFLIDCEFILGKDLAQTKDESLLRLVNLVLPVLGRPPTDRSKPSSYFTKLCLYNGKGILFSVTDIVKSLG